MAINKDIELEGQQAIPTRPQHPHAHSDSAHVKGPESMSTPDYNAPPIDGATKSAGAAADPGVGGALGEPPPAARAPGDNDPADLDARLGENQGGGDDIEEDMKPKR